MTDLAADSLALIGRLFIAFLAEVGRLVLFAARAVSHCVRPPSIPAC